MKQLTLEDFQPLVDSVFTVLDRDVELRLSQVSALNPQFAPASGRPPFSLIFIGPPGAVLPQGLVRLGHDAVGENSIFLVPVGEDARGISYQAVFN